MNNQFVISISSLDTKIASMQAKLIASRLSGDGFSVEAVDAMSLENQALVVYTRYQRGLYGPHEHLSPHRFAQLIGPLLKQSAKDPTSRPSVCVLANYTSIICLSQALKFKSEHERFGFYTWCDDYLYNQLQLVRPNINVLISSEATDNQVSIELTRLMPKDYIYTPGVDVSVANLNNKILGQIKTYLDKSNQSFEQASQIYQKASELITQNYELAVKNKVLGTDGLKSIELSEISPKLLKIIDLYDQPITKKYISVLDFNPKNELTLVPSKADTSYSAKSLKLNKYLQSGNYPSATYEFELSVSVHELIDLAKKIPISAISSVHVDIYPKSSDDVYFERVYKVLQAIKPKVSKSEFINLLPLNTNVLISFELELKQLIKLKPKLKKYALLSSLYDQLNYKHPLISQKLL